MDYQILQELKLVKLAKITQAESQPWGPHHRVGGVRVEGRGEELEDRGGQAGEAPVGDDKGLEGGDRCGQGKEDRK